MTPEKGPESCGTFEKLAPGTRSSKPELFGRHRSLGILKTERFLLLFCLDHPIKTSGWHVCKCLFQPQKVFGTCEKRDPEQVVQMPYNNNRKCLIYSNSVLNKRHLLEALGNKLLQNLLFISQNRETLSFAYIKYQTILLMYMVSPEQFMKANQFESALRPNH